VATKNVRKARFRQVRNKLKKKINSKEQI